MNWQISSDIFADSAAGPKRFTNYPPDYVEPFGVHGRARRHRCDDTRRSVQGTRGKGYSSQVVTRALRTSIALVMLCAVIPTISAQTPAAPKSSLELTSRYGPEFFAGKHPQTAFDMVNLLPGFVFSGGDPTIRGYAAAAGNVLIDGQRVSDKQFTLESVLQHIPVDEVDHIEVIEGGAPGVEMLGQSIVANVIRKKQAGQHVVLTLSNAYVEDGRNLPGGTLELTDHWSGGKTLTSALSASKYVELAEGDGPDEIRNPQGEIANATSVVSAAGGLNAYGYGTLSMPAWKGRVAINGSSSRTDYNYREVDNTSLPKPSLSELHEHLGGPLGGQLQNELGAHFSRDIGETWTSETNALGDYMGETYSSILTAAGLDERFFLREHVGETLARTDLRSASDRVLAAEFSAEGAYNWLTTSNTFTYDSIPIALPNSNARVSELRDQISGNVIWSKGKRVQIELGTAMENSLIRSAADVRRSKALTYVKPRFVLTLTPTSANHFRVRVEHEVNQLDFSNFVAASSLNTGSVRSGNTDIVPQQDWVFEGLYERHFWSDGDFVATYRHFLLADVLDRVPVSSATDPSTTYDAPGNIGDGSEDAVMVNLTSSLDHAHVKNAQIKLTIMQQWSMATDPTTSATRSISGIDPFEYSVDVQQDLSKWHSKWGASFLSPCAKSSTVKGCTETTYRFNEVDSYRATPTIDMFWEVRIGKGLLLHIEGDNLLREHFEWVISRYAGARNEFPLQNTEGRKLVSFSSLLFSVRKDF